MYVCMYVCVYVCVYIYIYIHTYMKNTFTTLVISSYIMQNSGPKITTVFLFTGLANPSTSVNEKADLCKED